MASYWANFATTGDPNGSGLPTWSPIDRVNNCAYLWFGEKFTATTSGSPYFGTAAEGRNALLREQQFAFYGVSW
jgi:hypothetical protein